MGIVNAFVSYVKKYKMAILAFILVAISLHYLRIREGFYATSCTQFKNCAECVNGKVIDTSSPCYWSSEKKKCGSFDDPGYSRKCYPGPDPDPDPEPEPGPGPCPVCPKLTLLKNPTYITQQS
jgi:hypothetical protein